MNYEQAVHATCDDPYWAHIVTLEERRARLLLAASLWPSPLVQDIPPAQVSRVLADLAHVRHWSKTTIRHMQVDLCWLFADLLRRGLVDRNPAAAELLRIPRGTADDREHTLLTDEEFWALVRAASTPPQLSAMAVASRCLGGARPSDLYALRWEDIDLAGWGWVAMPRPKTDRHRCTKRERIAIPEVAGDALMLWWVRKGCPDCGEVFPARIKRLAQALRAALRAAGCTRPELHEDTSTSRRAQFYSFRRQWVTALAASGTNAQVAMRLSGHTKLETHLRYHVPEILSVPEGVVPHD